MSDSVTTTNATIPTDNLSQIGAISRRYVTSPLHVRPEKNTEISLGILPKGSIIEGFQDGAWFKIIYQEKEAYVAFEFTSEEQMLDKKTLYVMYPLPIRPEKNTQ